MDNLKYDFDISKIMINPHGDLRPLVIKRCPYCQDIIKDGMVEYWRKKGYCSEWCWEMENPPKIEHVCKTCGIVVQPYKRPSTKGNMCSSGVYPTYCPEHVVRGRHKSI